MSSRRHLRRQACDGKFRFPDRDATLAARRSMGVRGADLDPYRCRFCHAWHLDHRPAHVDRAIRRRREGGL